MSSLSRIGSHTPVIGIDPKMENNKSTVAKQREQSNSACYLLRPSATILRFEALDDPRLHSATTTPDIGYDRQSREPSSVFPVYSAVNCGGLI